MKISTENHLIRFSIFLITLLFFQQAYGEEFPVVPGNVQAVARTYCEERVDSSIAESVNKRLWLYDMFIGDAVRQKHVVECVERELFHFRKTYFVTKELIKELCKDFLPFGAESGALELCVQNNELVIWNKVLNVNMEVVLQ